MVPTTPWILFLQAWLPGLTGPLGPPGPHPCVPLVAARLVLSAIGCPCLGVASRAWLLLNAEALSFSQLLSSLLFALVSVSSLPTSRPPPHPVSDFLPHGAQVPSLPCSLPSVLSLHRVRVENICSLELCKSPFYYSSQRHPGLTLRPEPCHSCQDQGSRPQAASD